MSRTTEIARVVARGAGLAVMTVVRVIGTIARGAEGAAPVPPDRAWFEPTKREDYQP